MACALISPCGHVELLARDGLSLNVEDILQEPIHSLAVHGFKLFFSSAAFFSAEVNEFASGITKQLIKGDACLVHDHQQQLVQYLQQSKHLRIAQSEGPCAPSSSSSSSGGGNSHALVPSVLLDHTSCAATSSSTGSPRACSCCDSSCQLKRPRSLQHIAAANSTRQRILRSMSATQHPAEPTLIPAPRGSSSNSGKGVTGAALSEVYSTSSDSEAGSSSFSCPGGGGRPPASSSHRRMPATAAGAAESVGAGSSRGGDSTVPFLNSFSRQQACTSAKQEALLQSRPEGNARDTCDAAAAAVAMDIDSAAFQQQQELAAAAVTAAAAPVWSDLPVEVVAQVARCLGNTVAAVVPICSTCRSWRLAVLEDDQLLAGLTFRLQAAAAPRSCISHRLTRRGLQHPRLLERAAKLGNVSALVVRARLLDAAGAPDEAMRCWRRAAKAGHLEGQLLFGLALYRGTAGVAPDAEDAHLWLSRALKQVLGPKQASNSHAASPSGSSSDSNTGTGSPASDGDSPTQEANRTATTITSSSNSGSLAVAVPSSCVGMGDALGSEACRLQSRVLTQAGLVLGYLSFDGEGTRTDTQEAVRCFKLAAQAGCREAQQVLGWMFNTGQY